MDRKRERSIAMLLGLLLVGSFPYSSSITYATTIYVTKKGSPAPTGDASAPYQTIEAGIVKGGSSPGCNVVIGAGNYYEMLTINAPCILKASEGTVTIGDTDYQASTWLDIITLNTHLAGDQVGMPSWKDKARAYDIAHFFGEANWSPDIVAFQEIWDEDLFFGGDGAAGILPMSGYPYGKHGTSTGGKPANSALAIMSKYPLVDFSQHSFWAPCYGWDCAANKGWLQVTITKDGFGVGLFVIHTQADNNPAAAAVRALQIGLFTSAINEYRNAHPNHIVFAMGDYNVFGEQAEYYDVLIPMMGNFAKGRDADRNSPGFVTPCSFTGCLEGGCVEQWTVSRCNKLALHFDDDTADGRLDYIFYFPSKDPSVEVIPKIVKVLPFRGRVLTDDGVTTNESSDHWSVSGKFQLIRH